MFSWLKKTIQNYQDRKRMERSIHPEVFKEIAREMRELADIAERLWPRQHKHYAKIKRIQAEMDQLDRITAKPQFKRLSVKKRLQLKESLISSREQLIETVQSAPSPTSTLQ